MHYVNECPHNDYHKKMCVHACACVCVRRCVYDNSNAIPSRAIVCVFLLLPTVGGSCSTYVRL